MLECEAVAPTSGHSLEENPTRCFIWFHRQGVHCHALRLNVSRAHTISVVMAPESQCIALLGMQGRAAPRKRYITQISLKHCSEKQASTPRQGRCAGCELLTHASSSTPPLSIALHSPTVAAAIRCTDDLASLCLGCCTNTVQVRKRVLRYRESLRSPQRRGS